MPGRGLDAEDKMENGTNMVYVLMKKRDKSVKMLMPTKELQVLNMQ